MTPYITSLVTELQNAMIPLSTIIKPQPHSEHFLFAIAISRINIYEFHRLLRYKRSNFLLGQIRLKYKGTKLILIRITEQLFDSVAVWAEILLFSFLHNQILSHIFHHIQVTGCLKVNQIANTAKIQKYETFYNIQPFNMHRRRQLYLFSLQSKYSDILNLQYLLQFNYFIKTIGVCIQYIFNITQNNLRHPSTHRTPFFAGFTEFLKFVRLGVFPNKALESSTLMECEYEWDQNILATNLKRRKFRDTTFTVYFPTDRIKDEKFQTSEEISIFLLQDALKIGLCKWQIFEKTVIDKKQHIKIIYTCRKNYCDARLVYIQKKPKLVEEGEKDANQNCKKYHLLNQIIVNHHRHILKLTPKVASQQIIRQYLFDLPIQDKVQDHVQAIKQKFNLTKCQTRYLKERVFWKFKNEDDMLVKLGERHVQFRRKTQTENDQVKKTIILLLVTETMKRSYKMYGDMMCFDITYKLLKKYRQIRKHVGVGFFVGQNQCTKIVLFGMCTITHESSQNLEAVFQYFFDICGSVPQTIITDDQIALGIALQRLKKNKNYPYHHLLDWFHKLEGIKKCTKESQRNQILTLYSRFLKESNKRTYYDIFYEIAEMTERPKRLKDFLRNQHRYCVSQVPPTFFGFGILSARAESFNNLIKKSVPYQTHLEKLIYFVFRIEKRLLGRLQPLQLLHHQLIQDIKDKQVKDLWKLLEWGPYQKLRHYHFESKNYQIVLNGKSPEHKIIQYIKYGREYKVNLYYDLKYDCWRCECRYIYMTGIPCPHLLKVIKEYKGCIGYYINERWFHNKHNAQKKMQMRPKAKNKGM